MGESCPFCSKDLTFRTVYATTLATAFLSRDGIARDQCLVTTKRHVGSIRDLTDKELVDVFRIAGLLTDLIVGSRGYDGVNLVINNGEAAGQTVNHFHLHLIPRSFGDSQAPRRWLSEELWAQWRRFTDEELKQNTDELRTKLNKQ